MKKSLFLLLFLSSYTVFGQTNSAQLIEVQKRFPSYYFVHESNLATFDAAAIDLMGEKLIIYNETTDFADFIKKHDPELDNEGDFIKEWLAFHQDIDIIKKSEATLMDEATIQSNRNTLALFLLGEEITYYDILNYQQ